MTIACHALPFLALFSIVTAATAAPDQGAPIAQNPEIFDISYRSQFNRSDLVVIGRALSTRDTDVTNTFSDGHSTFICIGLHTVFEVALVIKGDLKDKTFTLFHYRPPDGTNAPCWFGGMKFVSFELPDPNPGHFVAESRPDYLLFLKRTEHDNYVPVLGQDFAAGSVFELSDEIAIAKRRSQRPPPKEQPRP